MGQRILFTIHLFFFLFLSFQSKSQTVFQNIYGGSGEDIGYFIENTSDGGWIVTGTTTSFGAGSRDIFLLKLDVNGDVEWQRTYGSSGIDDGRTVRQTSDGGYVVSGRTGTDFYVFKVNSTGTIEWNRTINGGGDDYAVNMIITSDGGIAFAGDALISSLHYGFIAKLESDGDVLWARRINNISDNDAAYGITEAPGGDLMITGYTFSTGPGNGNGWRLRFNSSGTLVASHAYGRTGTSGLNGFYDITTTNDGNYIMVRNIDAVGAGGRDIWVLKTELDGDVVWSKAYGGTGYEEAYEIRNTLDNGYIISGITNSFGNGNYDLYLLKIDQDGNLEWSRTFGGSGEDRGSSVAVNSDGGYNITGLVRSSPATVADIFVAKTNSMGESINCSSTSPATVETSFTPDILTPSRSTTTIGTSSSPAISTNTPFLNENAFCIPLPVSFISFGGKVAGQQANLTWVTSEEIGLGYFEVERSFDGISFNSIGRIKSSNNSLQTQTYEWIDDLSRRDVYYRIKAVDLDGAYSYSTVVQLGTDFIRDILIYPNPVNQDEEFIKLQISGDLDSFFVVEFTDLNGQQIFKKLIRSECNPFYKIPVQGMRPGTYYIKVLHENKVTIEKLIVW